MKRFLAALALQILLPLAASAGTDAATAEELMRDSGVWHELGEVSSQVTGSIDHVYERAGDKLPASERARMERVVESAYSAERLRSIARAVFEKKILDRHVPGAREWYDSPAGTEIAKLENSSASDREGIRRHMVQGIALLEKMPPARRDLLERIVTTSRAVEATTRITMNSMMAVYRAIARANPDVPLPSEQELRDELESVRPKMEKTMQTEYLEICASVYAKVSDANLAKYEEFLASDAGRHLTDVFIEAVDAAMTDGAAKLGRDLIAPDGSGTTA